MPSINDLNKKPDFNIPDDYFERLQDEVLTKIHRYEKSLKQRRIFYSISSIAASLLIIFSTVYFFPDENSENFASLVSVKKEAQSMYDSITNQDTTEIKTEENKEVPQKNKIPMKPMIVETELDNLDYDIIEHYQESVYDLAFLDLYD